MKKLLQLALFLSICNSFTASAQLAAGDIVVIGIGTSTGPASPNLDEFSWVPLVDLVPGQVVYFTDAGWNQNSNEFMGSGSSSEILIKYVTPSAGLTAGTFMTVSEAGLAANYTVISGTKCGSDSNNLLTLNATGDQITVFTSDSATLANFPAPGSFTPIFSVTTSTTQWNSLSTGTSLTITVNRNICTNLVSPLNGTNSVAVGYGPQLRNGVRDARYMGSVTSGTKAAILAAISNSANWRRYDNLASGLPAGQYSPSLANGSAPTGWTSQGTGVGAFSVIDNTLPVLQSIGINGTPAANAPSVTFTLNFNKNVKNVSIDDFQTTTTGSASGWVSSVSASSGNGIQVTVSSITGTGTLRLTLKSNTNITDNSGNGNGTNGYVASLSSATHSIDREAPTVTIISPAPNPTRLGIIAIAFTFSETVTGFDASDFTITNGTAGTISGSGSNYTVNITPSSDGTVSVSVNAGAATDAAGNASIASALFSRLVDRVAPTFTINSSAPAVTNIAIPVTVTFDEPVFNFTAGDIVLSNGSITNFSGGNNLAVYTFNVVPTYDGTISVIVRAEVANDAAANPNSTALVLSRIYDSTRPTVIMSSVLPSPTNSTFFQVDIAFNEVVNDFYFNDVTVTNGSIMAFQSDGSEKNFIVYVQGISPGIVTLNIPAGRAFDAAGNENTASNQFSFVYDNFKPNVTISSLVPEISNSNSIPLTVTFSEPVSNFTPSDVIVTNGILTDFSGGTNLAVYTFTIIPSSDGYVTFTVPAGVANDAARNTNFASTPFVRTIDKASPSVTISSNHPDRSNVASIPFTITFSEPVINFTESDITLTNATMTNFSGNNNSTVYTFTAIPTSNGMVTVNVVAGVATDIAGNINIAATQLSKIYDTVSPSLSITANQPNPTNANSIQLTFNFSEPVTGFEIGDITILGGNLSLFTPVSASTYSVTVTPPGDGFISVFVFQNSTIDAAGNGNTFASMSIQSDRTRPTVSITSSEVSPTSINPIPITFTFSETVYNFTVQDITISGGSLVNFSGAGNTYMANFIPTGAGLKTLQLFANVTNDPAGNSNPQSNTFLIQYNSPCTISATWNGTEWNQLPVANQSVIISGNYTSSQATGGFSGCSLLVTNGAQVVMNTGDHISISGDVTVTNSTLTLESGANMTLGGNIIVSPTSAVTFENNANLLQTNNINGNSGNITIKRNTFLQRLDYVYWGSPVAGMKLKTFSPGTLSNRFYTHNEATNSFAVIPDIVDNTALANPIHAFEAAKGYMIRSSNFLNPAPNAPLELFEGTFTGVPNTGNYEITVANSNNSLNSGFNLISNPYPSPISAQAFFNGNPGVAGTLYFWTHGDQNPGSNNYATWNPLGVTPVNGPDSPNGIIQIGQGFLMYAPNPLPVETKAHFTNPMRLINNENQFFRTELAERHRFWLQLSNANQNNLNQTLIGYMDGATQGADNSMDGLLHYSGSSISSRIQQGRYITQGRSLPFDISDEVPLSFNATAAGDYTIGLEQFDGLFLEQDIFLKDNLTGVDHNLKMGDYTFVSEAGIFDSRFSIAYQTTLDVKTPIIDADAIVVYKDNGIIHINAGKTAMSSVKVFDIRGRLLYQKNRINATVTSLEDLTAEHQVLLLRVVAEGKVVMKKVVSSGR